ncbi:hypothetical protein [Paraburkholderia caribensis]|uniref:hypothetical protein n=1 Tax=Paraburkholderia caribensis TaxID=75105 RepID=UPI00286193AE|nr:hypothetical protein [Paraburkholderia caribensis]MDR6379662.1 hypothetical protein [Paraburkholderia caribensis]
MTPSLKADGHIVGMEQPICWLSVLSGTFLRLLESLKDCFTAQVAHSTVVCLMGEADIGTELRDWRMTYGDRASRSSDRERSFGFFHLS